MTNVESALSKQNQKYEYAMIMLVNLEATTDSDSDILQTPFSKRKMSPANAINLVQILFRTHFTIKKANLKTYFEIKKNVTLAPLQWPQLKVFEHVSSSSLRKNNGNRPIKLY